MSERPWYKRYGADFVHGTLGLTLEQKGAYSLCLDLIYDRGGPIPDDARWLAGVCGVSLRKWRRLREALIEAGKLAVVDGALTNRRAEKELEKAAGTARKHAENGAKGGLKSAQNRGALKEIRGLGEAPLEHRAHKPEARDQNEGACAPDVREAWPGHAFDRFWQAFPNKVGKGAAKRKFDQLARRPPLPLPDLMAALERYIARKPPDRQWCNPLTWLNQERWADRPADAANAPEPPPRDHHGFDTADWRGIVQVAVQRKVWRHEWGPPPGAPGCAVPRDLITPHLLEAVAAQAPS